MTMGLKMARRDSAGKEPAGSWQIEGLDKWSGRKLVWVPTTGDKKMSTTRSPRPSSRTKLLTQHPFYKDHDLDRDDWEIPCECWGAATAVPCTDEEQAKFGCGRPCDCCSVAFECDKCGTRWVGRRPAPEME
jgi:hypothetical protein